MINKCDNKVIKKVTKAVIPAAGLVCAILKENLL